MHQVPRAHRAWATGRASSTRRSSTTSSSAGRLDQAIDRFYRKEKSTAEAASHSLEKEAVKPDPDGVAKFLTDNPNVLTQLRKHRGLMSELTDRQFAAISQGKYDLQ